MKKSTKTKLAVILLWLVALILIVVVITINSSCSPVCTHLKTRCNGQQADVCDAYGQWQTNMDCDDVIGGHEPWECCLDEQEGGHTCLPESECGE